MSVGRLSLVVASLLASFVTRAVTAGDADLGRRLFEANWLVPAADGSPLAPAAAGDGIGPLFNGASCVECHMQGGSGGAGPREENVDVISVVLPFGADEATRTQTLRRAAAFHPAFREKSHVILHRFGRDETGGLNTYESFRSELLGRFPALPRPAAETELEVSGVTFQLAQRNTTAMFGGGVINRIPPEALIEVAAWQRAEHPEQAGRASLGGYGRFGWRGQVESLDAFIRMACADECGLRVAAARRGVHEQWDWPVRDEPIRRKARGPDLTNEQVDALVAFSASLPAPRPVPPESSAEIAAAEAGRRHFDAVGCVVCHIERLGGAEDIYSDLLLHDLGRAFADRVKAPSPGVDVKTFSVSNSFIKPGYYDEETVTITRTRTIVTPPSLNDFEVTAQEWKTPPLWGVADSAPYLHDGRADTLDDAIRLHGGQAAISAANYAALPYYEQKELLAFLTTLKAPRDAPIASTSD